MLKLSWLYIKNNTKSSILVFCSFLAIMVAGTIGLTVLFNIQTEVQENIKDHARGSYDLLIRPANSQTTLEKKLNKVEENYLTYGNGGISIQEWEQIKNLPNIEIAAPVASLGYFTGQSTSLLLDFPDSSSLLTLQFNTSDGINDYTVEGHGGYYYMLQQDGFYEGYDYIERAGIQTLGYGQQPEFMIPDTYHFIVGIDREEEEKLTGINLSNMENPLPHMLRQAYSDLSVGKHIPIVYLSDATASIFASANLTEIDWNSEKTLELKKQLNLNEQDPLLLAENYPNISELETATTLSENTFLIDLTKHVKPFYYDPIAYHYDGTFSKSDYYSFGLTGTSLFYQTKPIDYIFNDEKIIVEKVGVDSGVPIYREIEKQGDLTSVLEEIPFVLYPVGSFTTQSYEETLAASPLGIYQQSPVITKDGEILHETFTPGSFVSAPAHGLITLEDAEYIKGEEPIDAIRVKVAGIHGYDDVAIKKINDAVIDISKIGDFQIDIVAGASLSNVTMQVEGVGEVEQSMTTLGAAATIVDGWNSTNLIITSIFLLVSFIFIINNQFFNKQVRKGERQLFLDIGWTRKHNKFFNLYESWILLTLAAFASTILLIFLSIYEFTNVVTIPAFLGILIFAYLFVGLSQQTRRETRFSNIDGKVIQNVWLNNLYFYRKVLLLCSLQLIFITLLINFISTSLYSTYTNTSESTLGTFINNNLFISIIIILIAAFYLSITSNVQNISSFLIIRKNEFITLRDIGWQLKHVKTLCMKESMAWMLPSIVIALFINMFLLHFLYSLSLEVFLLNLATSIFVCIVCFTVAYIVLTKQLALFSR